MSNRSFIPPRRILLGPGPSMVPDRVLQAMARPTIGHLDPQFIELMDDIKRLLQYAFQTQNELTMPISGPGTAGMECCVVNLVEPGDRVLVAVNGVFGGRLKEMIERCGGDPIIVEDEWGSPIDPNKIADVLKRETNIKIAAFVHAETSTGALSDVKTLVEIAHRHGCLALVDAVTSLGGVPVMVDDWGIDAIYSGSQKCLSCAPGLSPISLNDRAVQMLRNRRTKVQSWFMDLNLVMNYWGSGTKRAYHHTAPINALYGLHEALLMLREEGLENAWARHRKNHLALKSGLEAMGLRLIVKEEAQIPQLNAIAIPEHCSDAEVRRRLLDDYNIEIGAGLGKMAGYIWRVGLMGCSSSPDNVALFLSALREILSNRN
ncbi:MAG: alanine--glyoxylate aminotransferase family protein [candidate division KSB1 bacterium]|nr:alanine--glyoxylate aminotransferase family protein [candidate division KSB1 bacterium]MDZ7318068.1 alanine--glyoxylate aminotransferase family protein [candidate division KSB1 bacterium]MDZ7339761.1 alanine--glyoxylate aminotransferase family protein [candidate division KSB1 bacterium]